MEIKNRSKKYLNNKIKGTTVLFWIVFGLFLLVIDFWDGVTNIINIMLSMCVMWVVIFYCHRKINAALFKHMTLDEKVDE